MTDQGSILLLMSYQHPVCSFIEAPCEFCHTDQCKEKATSTCRRIQESANKGESSWVRS